MVLVQLFLLLFSVGWTVRNTIYGKFNVKLVLITAFNNTLLCFSYLFMHFIFQFRNFWNSKFELRFESIFEQISGGSLRHKKYSASFSLWSWSLYECWNKKLKRILDFFSGSVATRRPAIIDAGHQASERQQDCMLRYALSPCLTARSCATGVMGLCATPPSWSGASYDECNYDD